MPTVFTVACKTAPNRSRDEAADKRLSEGEGSGRVAFSAGAEPATIKKGPVEGPFS